MKRKINFIFLILIIICAMAMLLTACDHKHKWSGDWSTDATHHWHECKSKKCSEQSDKAEHTFVYKYNGEKHWQECSECGFTKGEIGHSFINSYDDSYHWKECSECGYGVDKMEHNLDSNCECTECDFAHPYEIRFNETHCWSICTICGDSKIKDKKEHIFKPITPECSICGFMKGSEGINYQLNSDGKSYCVTGVDTESYNHNVIVQAYFGDYPVTKINNSAFANLNITSAILPSTLEYIGEYAFSSCKQLAEIVIPEKVTTIGTKAFDECYGITIKVEAKQAHSGWDMSSWRINQFCYFPVVYDCKNNNVADDGYEYFVATKADGTSYDIKYGIKGGVAVIAKQPQLLSVYDFNNDNSKAGYVKYKGREYKIVGIQEYAFYNNELINQIIVPNYVATIGEKAFGRCINLTSVRWKSNGNNLPDDMGVKTFGIGAFEDCTSLTNFVVPKRVTSLPTGMFKNCTSLDTVWLDSEINKINENVFDNCSSLTKINYASSQSDWQKIVKESNWDINVGNYSISYGTKPQYD